jgi:nucleoside-diphosphate-sugar epimerase
MRILITGATGFVGGHLVKRLLNEQHEVHLLVRPSTDLNIFKNDLHRLVSHRHNTTTKSMIQIVESAQPDAVIHVASLFLGEHQSKNVDDLIQSNVLLSTQLAEAMAVNDVKMLINVGTAWQHYENADYSPVNLYAATKQAFRSILSYYIETCKLKVINLELFDTFGPNDQRGKLFALLDRLRKTVKSLAMSPGDQQIDPIYIDDVSEAFVVALNRLSKGQVESEETYSVRSEKPVALRELVTIYEEVTGSTLNIEWGGRPYRAREVMQLWSRGETLPGWTTKISLREGIKKVTETNV